MAEVAKTVETAKETVAPAISSDTRFYSPLVKNIAKKEGITQSVLDALPGSGKEGRVTKNDILAYLDSRSSKPVQTPQALPVVKSIQPVKTVKQEANWITDQIVQQCSWSGKFDQSQLEEVKKHKEERQYKGMFSYVAKTN